MRHSTTPVLAVMLADGCNYHSKCGIQQPQNVETANWGCNYHSKCGIQQQTKYNIGDEVCCNYHSKCGIQQLWQQQCSSLLVVTTTQNAAFNNLTLKHFTQMGL